MLHFVSKLECFEKANITLLDQSEQVKLLVYTYSKEPQFTFEWKCLSIWNSLAFDGQL